MLQSRRAALLQRCAAFATQASPQDYSLVMSKAAELAKVSEAPTPKETGYTSGVPLETFARKVRIFVPPRTASQQGLARTVEGTGPAWKLAFDTRQKWINPLIGWTSTADPLEHVARASLAFFTREQAVAFCEKHGWEYTVEEPQARRTARQKRFLGYGDNFTVKRQGVPDTSTLPSNRQSKPSGKALAAASK